MSDYSLSINGAAPITLQLGKGVEASRELNSLSSSWLKIQTTESFAAAAQWASGNIVELFLNGTRIFVGTCVSPSLVAEWNSQGKKYLVECPWRRFRRTPYEVPFTYYADDTASAAETMNSPLAFLFGDGDAAEMVKTVIAWLIADQVAFPALAVPAFVQGTVDATLQLRPTLATDTMCSDIVKLAMQYLQDAASWWDWTATGQAPAFNLRSSANWDVVALPAAGAPVSEWEVQSNSEQRVAFVHMVLKTQLPPAGAGDPLGNVTVLSSIQWPPDYHGPMFGGISHMVSLANLDDFEDASSFAEDLFTSTNNIGWLGKVTVTGRDIAANLRPGIAVTMTGGGPDTAGFRGLIFSTKDNLKTGQTTATFTPPKVYSIQALQAMLRNSWPPAAPSDINEQATGRNTHNSYGKGDHNNPGTQGTVLTATAQYEVVKSVGGVPTPSYDLVVVPLV